MREGLSCKSDLYEPSRDVLKALVQRHGNAVLGHLREPGRSTPCPAIWERFSVVPSVLLPDECCSTFTVGQNPFSKKKNNFKKSTNFCSFFTEE